MYANCRQRQPAKPTQAAVCVSATVGGDYANFPNQTHKAAKLSVASEIAAHQVKREIAKVS